eukprot:CAMPEP_0204177182 /NCGR_PEP_ID=MMETSP0361-20130328/48252_1 /ASSEMBLY_ACC=CAM_ASM_000343 /TAXON_ID=268821 /ORGANISM="Scrippsiella Hangoei, Strain SHTV-5" /LENGTH=39 /DNA_ID= /DNA_START= /DNA_END= /DNA_ORIENTATION=
MAPSSSSTAACKASAAAAACALVAGRAFVSAPAGASAHR